MFKWATLLLITQAVVIFSCSSSSAATVTDKKVIEFGWDEPDTAFLKEHIHEMEQMPFDGCVFHVMTQIEGKPSANFTWSVWGKRSFSESELSMALSELKSTPLRTFQHNFLRFNVTPGDVDWFEGFSTISNNAYLAAHLAKQGKCAGILFDVEPYEKPLFDFRKQQGITMNTWQEYQKQVRQRGKELMTAWQRGYPELTVFLTFGYSIAWVQMERGKKPQQECQYGLLPALLDGMLESAQGRTRVIDGCELAYSYKQPQQFERMYQTMRTNLLPIVAAPNKYASVMSLGFGLWLDYDSHKRKWELNDLDKNYFTPEQFKASVTSALHAADEYVWIYTEQPRWWSGSGATNLPAAYVQALKDARGTGPRSTTSKPQ